MLQNVIKIDERFKGFKFVEIHDASTDVLTDMYTYQAHPRFNSQPFCALHVTNDSTTWCKVFSDGSYSTTCSRNFTL